MSYLFQTFYQSFPKVVSRSFHASLSLRDENLNKMLFNMKGFHKYGLLSDDLLSEFDDDIVEAVRRLPEEEQMQRKYRAIRATQAEITHSILPKEQWTKYEDNHYYLQPYLEELKREKEEIREWEANH